MPANLGRVLYDPTTSVNKVTTPALAMTAFDTMNARITFVAPPNGVVRAVIGVVAHDATTFPQVFLGVMEGATVRARVAPMGAPTGTALATTFLPLRAEVVIGGLTPGQTYIRARDRAPRLLLEFLEEPASDPFGVVGPRRRVRLGPR
jgi:hypothetical protein